MKAKSELEAKPELHIVEPLNRLDQGDFDLFIPALRSVQASAQTVQQARQEMAKIEATHTANLGALSYVMKHLAPKYQMAEGDDIDGDGVIIRKVK